MGHSRLLSKPANLLRKTRIKIGRYAIGNLPSPRSPPHPPSPGGPGGQARARGCPFGSPVSIVTAPRSGAARGGAPGPPRGNGLGVNVVGGASEKQEWTGDNGRSQGAAFHPDVC